MFESAVAFTDRRDQKQVTRHRCRLAEEVDLPFADPLQVGAQALGIAVVLAGEGDFVQYAAGGETHQGEFAHFDGVIDQFVVIFCLVKPETLRRGILCFECRGDAPMAERRIVRWPDIDQAGLRFLPEHAQKDAGAVKEAVCLIEMRAPYRQIPGVDFAGNGQCPAGRECFCLPGLLVEFAQVHRLAARFGANGDDVPGKIADQITAGNPGRQGKTLTFRRRCGDLATHFEAVRGRVQWTDGVADRIIFHERPWHLIGVGGILLV